MARKPLRFSLGDITDRVLGANFWAPRFWTFSRNQVHPEVRAVGMVLSYLIDYDYKRVRAFRDLGLEAQEFGMFQEAAAWAWDNPKDSRAICQHCCDVFEERAGVDFLFKFSERSWRLYGDEYQSFESGSQSESVRGAFWFLQRIGLLLTEDKLDARIDENFETDG